MIFRKKCVCKFFLKDLKNTYIIYLKGNIERDIQRSPNPCFTFHVVAAAKICQTRARSQGLQPDILCG